MTSKLIKTVTYQDWNEAKGAFVNDICGTDELEIENWIFRGQSSENWKLISSFDRLYRNLPNKKTYEKATLAELETFLKKTKGYPQDLDDIQLRAFAQHYGMPTRLLDWTFSPYIALFFAFANPASENEQYVTVFALNRKHDIWKKNSGCEIIDGAHIDNEHHKRQQGAFTLLLDANTLEDFIDSYRGTDNNHALIRVLYSKQERSKVLKDLRLMNITFESLFTGKSSLVKAAEMEAQMKCNIIQI